MAAVVDLPRAYRSGLWSHLLSDGGDTEELHAFAERLGLRRSWFQETPVPHYDLRPSKHRRALALGARPVSCRELAKLVAALKRSRS